MNDIAHVIAYSLVVAACVVLVAIMGGVLP